MDGSLPADQYAQDLAILERDHSLGVDFHALRTREAGARCFISLHVLVPGAWTVTRGHQMVEDLESEVRQVLPQASLLTHLEPLDDPVDS